LFSAFTTGELSTGSADPHGVPTARSSVKHQVVPCFQGALGCAMEMSQRKFIEWAWCSFTISACIAILPAVGLLRGLSLGQTLSSSDPAHFRYDAGLSLGVKQLSTKTQQGVTIQDITYVGADGDTVPAYLVIPPGTGKFAAIIWGHWLMPGTANSSREEFLYEATALAPRRVVSLLIDAPQRRPGFKPTPNPVLVAQQVIDLRRGLDLLLSRSDVDASRIAYVGHSWNAGTGAILDATDKRLAAFVFMSGPQSTNEYVLSSDSPRMVASRKTADMGMGNKISKRTHGPIPVPMRISSDPLRRSFNMVCTTKSGFPWRTRRTTLQ
jgi:hypothetical protein